MNAVNLLLYLVSVFSFQVSLNKWLYLHLVRDYLITFYVDMTIVKNKM